MVHPAELVLVSGLTILENLKLCIFVASTEVDSGDYQGFEVQGSRC